MADIKTMLAGRSLLLVEDDYLIAEVMTLLLEANGAQVIGPAASVAAAIKLIEQTERIDGAFVDINLQGVMSWPVADALFQHGVRFVFITGYDSAPIPAPYIGIVRCKKPISLDKAVKALFGYCKEERRPPRIV